MTQVKEVKGDDVVCLIKNSAVLAGTLYTLHASQIHIDLPTLNDKDKEVKLSYQYDNIQRSIQIQCLVFYWLLVIDCRLSARGESKTMLTFSLYLIHAVGKTFEKYGLHLLYPIIHVIISETHMEFNFYLYVAGS